MTTYLERREPGTTTNRSHADLRGTWTIDPATSIVSFARRTLRLWTVTGRRHCLGVIHLDALPPAGVIRFQQPSDLPFLTMASDPASLEIGKWASGLDPTIRLELAVRARRLATHSGADMGSPISRLQASITEREMGLQRGSHRTRNDLAHLLNP